MSKEEKYFKIKDAAGSVFLCPLSALKRVDEATEEELANCVEEEVVGRYAAISKSSDRPSAPGDSKPKKEYLVRQRVSEVRAMSKEIVSKERFVELVNEEVIRHPKYKDGTKVLEINANRACGFDFYVDPAADRKEQEAVIIEARGFIGKKYDFEK